MLNRRRCCRNVLALLLITIFGAVALLSSIQWKTHSPKKEIVQLPFTELKSDFRDSPSRTFATDATSKILISNNSNNSKSVNEVHVEDVSVDSVDMEKENFWNSIVEREVKGNSGKVNDQLKQPLPAINWDHSIAWQRKPMPSIPADNSSLIKRFPKFIIIGLGKTGTKALYEALKLHPSLKGPFRERRFFSLYYKSGMTSYLASMPEPPPQGYIIEKSPDYITHPRAAKRIVESAGSLGIDVSKLKFIVVLRNPIDRAMSEYMEWNLQKMVNHRPLLSSFHRMVLTKEGEVNASLPFLNASCYAYHIRKWLEMFPKDQMCYVDGDVFASNPFEEVHLLEECLGIRHSLQRRNFVYMPDRGFYCFRVGNQRFCLNRSKGRRHPDVPDHVVVKLKTYFRPWNEQLLELTGRQFSDWEHANS